MARQWIVKRRIPTWVKIAFLSVLGYAAIAGAMMASAFFPGK